MVMEYVGFDESKVLMERACDRIDFYTISQHGFSHYLDISDILGALVGETSGKKTGYELAYKLRARLTSMM